MLCCVMWDPVHISGHSTQQGGLLEKLHFAIRVRRLRRSGMATPFR